MQEQLESRLLEVRAQLGESAPLQQHTPTLQVPASPVTAPSAPQQAIQPQIVQPPQGPCRDDSGLSSQPALVVRFIGRL